MRPRVDAKERLLDAPSHRCEVKGVDMKHPQVDAKERMFDEHEHSVVMRRNACRIRMRVDAKERVDDGNNHSLTYTSGWLTLYRPCIDAKEHVGCVPSRRCTRMYGCCEPQVIDAKERGVDVYEAARH